MLAVLLLRGPQTPGELKARTERMAPVASLADVERVLGVLTERDYVRRIGRRPGQKEDRFEHLLGGAGGASADGGERVGGGGAYAEPTPAPARAPVAPALSVTRDGELADRIAALEAEVASLRAELEELRQIYG